MVELCTNYGYISSIRTNIGTRTFGRHGGSGTCTRFDVADDNCITQVNIAASHIVASVGLVFRDGTEKRVEGRGGDPQTAFFEGGCLSGIKGRAGGLVD